MLLNQFKLLTNKNRYRLKRRHKKHVWFWVRKKIAGIRSGEIEEFKTIAEAHWYLIENFANSDKEDVWTVVEDIDIEVLANSTNGAHKS